jgi:hypothetical protein
MKINENCSICKSHFLFVLLKFHLLKQNMITSPPKRCAPDSNEPRSMQKKKESHRRKTKHELRKKFTLRFCQCNVRLGKTQTMAKPSILQLEAT